MSNEQHDRMSRTPGSPPDGSPWASADAAWQPQSYHDAEGRDPRLPFGQPPPTATAPPRTHIEDFRPPEKSRLKPALLIAGVVGAVALLLVALQFFGPLGDEPPTAVPSPAATPSPGTEPDDPAPAATGGTSIPFEGNGTGTFEILSQSWTADGLELRFRVSVDQGEQSFSLYLFNNASMEVSDPLDLSPFYARAGEPHEGTVVFPVERGESTLVLASGFGRALTALPVGD